MRTIETTVYSFDELSDQAKEKAREWFREGNLDYDWFDSLYDDAVQIGEILGIEFDQRLGRTMGGKQTRAPKIWWSGFYSQGDGACFEGSWVWKACSKAIRDYAPKDETLHDIADRLTAIDNGEGFSARMKHSGHYYHSGCMSVDVEFSDEVLGEDKELPQAEFSASETAIIQAMRDFADWIYSSLEKEHDWLQADEQVDESIRANEYEFEEDGSRA